MTRAAAAALCITGFVLGVRAQTVPAFPPAESLPVLPGLADPFLRADGSRVANMAEWPAQREYLKAMLAHYQFGHMPPKPASFEIAGRTRSRILDGAAVQEIFQIRLRRSGHTVSIRAGVVRPDRKGRFPVIVKNDAFLFSLAEIADPRSRQLYESSKREDLDQKVFREALKRGYAICKFNREDVAADKPGNRGGGVFPLYPEPRYDWGTIAAWAWAYQVIVDALSREDWADAAKIVATGHSRGGKTALCAAIYDERIAISVPSASGSGGTGSWRFFDPSGSKQDVGFLVKQQPHWFGPNLIAFAGREDRLPFDGHTAKALIAPRPLLNTHGRDDPIANPLGTQATFQAAQAVYEWLGKPGNQGLVWRPGGHGQFEEDWMALFDFADLHFFGKRTERDFRQMPHPAQAPLFGWRAPGASR